MNYDSDSWNRRCAFVDEAMRSGKFASRADADRAVVRQHPELAGAKPTGTQSAPGGGSAEAQLDRLARQITGTRHVSYAQAYVEALNSNPALYLQFLREHEAALKARRG